VIWRSDAPGVATVSSRGEVTALGPGSATITATASGVSRSIGVTVTAPAVDTRSALEGLVDAYARALQSGSIDEVRRAYPGMTSEQERQLRESIQFIERADLGIASLQDSGDTATASVEGTYEFLIDGRRSSSEVSFRATFERVGGTWTMTRTQ
jgi:alpha-L-fucosidase 2